MARMRGLLAICPMCGKKHNVKKGRFLERTHFNWIGYATTIICPKFDRWIWKLYDDGYKYKMYIPVGQAAPNSSNGEDIPF